VDQVGEMTELAQMWIDGMWSLLALMRAWVPVITAICVGVAWMLSPIAAAYVVAMLVRWRSGAPAMASEAHNPSRRQVAQDLLLLANRMDFQCKPGAREEMVKYGALGLLDLSATGSCETILQARLTRKGKAYIAEHLGVP